MQLIQDWKPYKESIIWDIANNYYLNKGIDAWSDSLTGSKKIPHHLTSNYQNAYNTALLVKILLEKHDETRKFKILECGSGSGKFSRNFLFALDELNILDKVIFTISDFSKQNLSDISNRALLKDFNNDSYQFLELDLTKNSLSEKFDLILINYVFNSMKLTILKNHSINKFKELELKIFSPSGDIDFSDLSNFNLQRSLIREHRWVDYDSNLFSDEENYFFGFLKNIYSDSNKSFAFYFNVMHSIKKLINNLNEHGVIFITELVPIEADYDPFYLSFPMGNALGHDVDLRTILKFFSEMPIHQSSKFSSTTARVFLSNSDIKFLDDFLDRFYGKSSKFFLLMDLLANLDEKSLDLEYLDISSKTLIDLNPYSPLSYKLRSRFFELSGHVDKSLEMISIAKKLDFWGES